MDEVKRGAPKKWTSSVCRKYVRLQLCTQLPDNVLLEVLNAYGGSNCDYKRRSLESYRKALIPPSLKRRRDNVLRIYKRNSTIQESRFRRQRISTLRAVRTQSTFPLRYGRSPRKGLWMRISDVNGCVADVGIEGTENSSPTQVWYGVSDVAYSSVDQGHSDGTKTVGYISNASMISEEEATATLQEGSDAEGSRDKPLTVESPIQTPGYSLAPDTKEVDARKEHFPAMDRLIADSRRNVSEDSRNALSVDLQRIAPSYESLKYLIDEYGHDINRLCLACNRLFSLHIDAQACWRLQYLNLRGNLFQEFPRVLRDLPALEILDISRNQLSDLPNDISSFKALKVLQVAQNRLQALPNAMGDMTQLKLVFISENAFSDPVLIDLGKQIADVSSLTRTVSYLTTVIKQHLKNALAYSINGARIDPIAETGPWRTTRTTILHVKALAERNWGESRDIVSKVRDILTEARLRSGFSQDAADIASLLSRYSDLSIATFRSSMSICSTNSDGLSRHSRASVRLQLPDSTRTDLDARTLQGPHKDLVEALMAESHTLKLCAHEAGAVDGFGYNALHIAAKFEACADQILLVMDSVQDINQSSIKGETFLHLLKPHTHPGCGGWWGVNVERILQGAKLRGFRFDAQDFEGTTALEKLFREFANQITAFGLMLYVQRSLQGFGAEHLRRALTLRNNQGMNLIHLFKSRWQFPCRERELGTDFAFPKSEEGDNPINYLCASFGAGPKTFNTMLMNQRKGTSTERDYIKVWFKIGCTPGDYVSSLEKMLSYGVGVNGYNTHGLTPLMVLIAQGSKIWKDLSLGGAENGNKRDQKQQRKTLETEYVRCIEILVRAGARLTNLDRYGDTVLLQTILQGFQLGFCVLVELGANINVRNKRTTLSALQIAQDVHRRCSTSPEVYERRRRYQTAQKNPRFCAACTREDQDVAFAHSLWILTLLVDLGASADPSLEQELGLGLYNPQLRRIPQRRVRRERKAVIEEEEEEEEDKMSGTSSQESKARDD